MKEIKILFVNLPSVPLEVIVDKINSTDSSLEFFCPISMPLGILYLSSYLKKCANNYSISSSVLDYAVAFNKVSSADYSNLGDFIRRPATEIKFEPDIIASSVLFSISYPFFIESIKMLKEIWPKALMVVGGTHVTNYGKRVFDDTPVDYLFLGEGERSFQKFVENFANSKKTHIRGVYHRKKCSSSNGKTTELLSSDQISDLNELPYPDWNIIDMDYYVSHGRTRETNALMHKSATIMTTRGCPYHCTFCSSHTVHGRTMRLRSVENVIDEIKILNKKYNVNCIIFEDDMFTLPGNRVKELLKRISTLEIENFEIQLPNALSVNSLSEEIIDLLLEAKMKVANLAIESGSQHIQDHVIKKHCNLRKAEKLVKYFQSKGIIVRCYFILGFFSETKQQMQETIEYAKNLAADWAAFFIAVPLIGSEMYTQFMESGYLKEDQALWISAHYMTRNFDTLEVSAEELVEIAYDANITCNFIFNPNKLNGQYDKAVSVYKDIVSKYPFHVIGWQCLSECYEALGQKQKAYDCKEKIEKLITVDSRAAKLHSKYFHLFK